MELTELVGRTLRYTPEGGQNAYRRVLVEDVHVYDYAGGGKLLVRIENAPSVGKAVPVYNKKTTYLPAYMLERGMLEVLPA